MGYSYERSVRIWNDDTGSYINVAPDKDGLGLIEIEQVYDKNTINTIVITPEEASFLITALSEMPLEPEGG